MIKNTKIPIIFLAFLLVSATTHAEQDAPKCPSAAPPVEEVLKKTTLEGLKLVTHQKPTDGVVIKDDALPEDEWFALQRAHFARRVSLGIPSGQNDFYLYEAPDGNLVMFFAARGCHIGTMKRDKRWEIASSHMRIRGLGIAYRERAQPVEFNKSQRVPIRFPLAPPQ